LENGFCRTHAGQATTICPPAVAKSNSPPRKRARTVEKIPPAKRQKLSPKKKQKAEKSETSEPEEEVEEKQEKSEKVTKEAKKKKSKTRTVEAPPSKPKSRTVEPPPGPSTLEEKKEPAKEEKSSEPAKPEKVVEPEQQEKAAEPPKKAEKEVEESPKEEKLEPAKSENEKRSKSKEKSKSKKEKSKRERSRSRSRKKDQKEEKKKDSKVDVSLDNESEQQKAEKANRKRKRRRFTETADGHMSISAERSVSVERKKSKKAKKEKTKVKEEDIDIKVKKEDTTFFDFSGGEDGFSCKEESSDDSFKDYTDEKVRSKENLAREKYRSGSMSPPPPTRFFSRKTKVKKEKGRKRRKKFTGPSMPEGNLPKQSRFNNVSDLPLTIPKRESNFPGNRIKALHAEQSSIEARLAGLKSSLDTLENIEEPVLIINETIDPGLYDSRVKIRGRQTRKGKALKFFKKGSIPAKGERLDRLLSRQFIHKQPSAVAAAYLDETFNYVSDSEIPATEWWDRPYCGNNYETKKLNTDLVTSYVNHPAALADLSKTMEAKQLTLFLTKKEKKKIKRKKTKDKHDAMIDAIRLGLQEPPEPKLKLSSIVRVLGSQFIADPSAAEAKARAQMDFRKMKHELHNEQRKLTASQRSDKKRKKLQEDVSTGVHTAVFRIYNLDDSQIRWKITVNAKQYNLTGCMMMHKKMSMVMVEGGPKGIRKYTALMTRRIRWKQDIEDKPCALVWQGTTGTRVFSEFVIETFEQESDIIKYLDQKTVLGYWKQCKEHQAVERIDATEE